MPPQAQIPDAMPINRRKWLRAFALSVVVLMLSAFRLHERHIFSLMTLRVSLVNLPHHIASGFNPSWPFTNLLIAAVFTIIIIFIMIPARLYASKPYRSL